MTSERERYSGELKFSDDTLTYTAEAIQWSVNIADVRLIGEFTNSNGPFIDDYFVVFLTTPDHGYEASFYAQGTEEVLAALSQKLGSPIEWGLCNSAEYKTRIMWPPKWKGEEMRTILPAQKKGWWRRLFDLGLRETVPSKATLEAFTD